MKNIFVVDDQLAMLENLKDFLSDEGYSVSVSTDGAEALNILAIRDFDCIILDVNLPKIDGLTVLKNLKLKGSTTPVIIFTAYGSSERTIEAMKLGAFDYIEKPFDIEEFLIVVQRAIKYSEIVDELQNLREQVKNMDVAEQDLIGNSSKMREIFKLIGKAAPSEATVLIEGESGTGKELIANAIHRHSLRSNKPFIKINCAALPLPLLESELFGHEKGAYTDAYSMQKGRFELADKGTILLDEIGEISLELQTKLLRVIQQKTFERVGGKETLSCDVRILASTNRDLKNAIKEGKFREDLYYRLNVINIKVPPLREHPEDIPSLIDHFLRKYSNEKTKSAAITDDALNKLLKHSWTGNVRELENVVQRSLVLSDGNFITLDDLSFLQPSVNEFVDVKNSDDLIPMKEIISKVEKDLIMAALHKSEGNKSKAATILGINRRVLFNKIKELNISEDSI
jgi:two-component system response regulator AtoC